MKAEGYKTSELVARVNLDISKFDLGNIVAQYRLGYVDTRTIDELVIKLEQVYDKIFPKQQRVVDAG